MCLRTKKKKPYKTQNYRDMVMKIYIGDISGDILLIQRFIIHSHTKEIHNTASVFYSVNTEVLILLIFVQVIILGMYNIIITPSSDLFPDWSRLI